MQIQYLQLQAKFRQSSYSTEISADPHMLSKSCTWQFQEVPGIRWYNLRELLLCIKKCALTSFVALGMRSDGNVPGNVEPTVGLSLTTMLQHTGRH
jgi:hypothetical protein